MNGQDVKNGVIRYWQLGVILLGLVASWTTLKLEVSYLKEAVAQNKIEAKERGNDQDEVEDAVIELKVTQKVIKEDVKDMREEQKAQSKTLDKILEEIRKQ